MRIKPVLPLLLSAALALTGCADLFSALGVMGVKVTGQVKVPEQQRAAIGGFEAYRTAASFASEVAVGANAEVQSYTVSGLPVATSKTQTDASGRFSLDAVPAERVSVIRATVSGQNGKTLRLAALVKASGDSTVVELSALSTIVVEGLLRTVETAKLEAMTQSQIAELEMEVAGAAGTANQNPDLSGASDPANRFEAIVSADARVKDLVAAVKANMTTAALR